MDLRQTLKMCHAKILFKPNSYSFGKWVELGVRCRLNDFNLHIRNFYSETMKTFNNTLTFCGYRQVLKKLRKKNL